MTRNTFDKLVNAIKGDFEAGDGVFFETSYGSFYLYAYPDGTYRLEMNYKYACGLDENLAPIYHYMDDWVWITEFISREELYNITNKILAGDPYGTDYSKRNAQKIIKGCK